MEYFQLKWNNSNKRNQHLLKFSHYLYLVVLIENENSQ